MPELKLPLRVLFLCTQNSARSQLAEALLNARGDDRVRAGSAGTRPAERVNPFARELLASRGIGAEDARPKSIDDVADERWDVVITVCDSAQEECPILPGVGATGHWGVEDPAGVTGSDEQKRRAFSEAARVLERRIERLLSLPLDTLDIPELEREVREIGKDGLPA